MVLVLAIVIPCLVAALRQTLTEAFATFFAALLRPLRVMEGSIDTKMEKYVPKRRRGIDEAEAPDDSQGPDVVVSAATIESALDVIAQFAVALVLAALFALMFWADILVNALRFIGLFRLSPDPERLRSLSERADILSGASLACVAATYGLFLFDVLKFSKYAFFRLDDTSFAARVVKRVAVTGFFGSLILAALFFTATQLAVAYRGDAPKYGYIPLSVAFAALYGALLVGALAIAGVAVPHVLFGLILLVIGSTRLLVLAPLIALISVAH